MTKRTDRLLRLALLVALLSASQSLRASGARELPLSPEAVEHFRALPASQLPDEVRYMGSTERWHLFGLLLTSTEGDHPFDSVYGFRVPIEQIDVNNGWTLNQEDRKTWVTVGACPMARWKTPERRQLQIPKDRQACRW